MEDENKPIESQEQKPVENTNNYIEAIKEIKKNSVSKDEYNKLEEENKKLLESLVKGETIEQPSVELIPDLKEIRNTLFNKDVDNITYIENALKLREETLKRTGKDIFCPYGRHIAPTEEDRHKADNVAKLFKHCLEYADGDNKIFTDELQRHMIDPVLPPRYK